MISPVEDFDRMYQFVNQVAESLLGLIERPLDIKYSPLSRDYLGANLEFLYVLN